VPFQFSGTRIRYGAPLISPDVSIGAVANADIAENKSKKNDVAISFLNTVHNLQILTEPAKRENEPTFVLKGDKAPAIRNFIIQAIRKVPEVYLDLTH
jgi:hypothetical protein